MKKITTLLLLAAMSMLITACGMFKKDDGGSAEYDSGYVCFLNEFGTSQLVGVDLVAIGEVCVALDQGDELCTRKEMQLIYSDLPGCFRIQDGGQANIELRWGDYCFAEESRSSVDLRESAVTYELTRSDDTCNEGRDGQVYPLCGQYAPASIDTLDSARTQCRVDCAIAFSDDTGARDACMGVCDTEFDSALSLNESNAAMLNRCCTDADIADNQPVDDNICR